MKKIIYLPVLLLALALTRPSLAQKCDSSHLGTIIEPAVDVARNNIFKRKFAYLKMRDENKDRVCNAQAFLDLLTIVTDPGKNYDGLRVYFAVRTKQKRPDIDDDDKMMLIFVPTTLVNDSVHDDKSSPCYIFKKGNLLELPHDTASKWVRRYERFRLNIFEDQAENEHWPDFKETTSLFYSRSTIDSTDPKARGVKQYLDCLINNHIAGPVRIKFAGFETAEYQNQLTLTFDLNERPPRSLKNGAATVLHLGFNPKAEFIFSPNADTGSPCPPASCGGSTLSNRR